MKTQRNTSCLHNKLPTYLCELGSYVYAVVKDDIRPKFSFHSHTHGETSSKISDMAEYFELADDQAAMEEDPIAECPNDCDEISDNTEDAVSKLLIPPPHQNRVTKRSSNSVIFFLFQWISN